METTTAPSNALSSTITNVFNDKPDELVSTGTLDASQSQLNQQQTMQTQQSQEQSSQQLQQQQQQKKCLHHRIYNNNSNSSAMDRIAALIQQQILPPQQQPQQQQYRPPQQQVQQTQSQQNHIQYPIIHQIQHPPPQQQHQVTSVASMARISRFPLQQQQQQQQQPQTQSISNNVNINGNVQSNGQIVIGMNANNSSTSNSNNNSLGGISNNTAVIHNQNGLVQPVSAALLAERYLLMDLVEGSTLYKCIDIKTREELVCKVANNPCSNLLSAHFRLDGHSHVNPLHKVVQGASQTYLFFTPSQGDLHSYVRVRKRLREPEAKRLFRQMCEVVKSCHEQGIVLRDLKLRKFVFADAERTHLRLESLEDAVVLDNPNEDLLQDKRGCPAYVSPEILKANTMYSGKAADMWSLGVILYTMLVGRYPFNDSEHASLFAKISRGQFLVPDCLTSKARCMIRSLLRKEPEERILSEDILLHPWMTVDENRDYTKSSSDQLVPDINVDV